jgi:hypothetical protein
VGVIKAKQVALCCFEAADHQTGSRDVLHISFVVFHYVVEIQPLVFRVLYANFSWNRTSVDNVNSEFLLRIDFNKTEINNWFNKLDDWSLESSSALE